MCSGGSSSPARLPTLIATAFSSSSPEQITGIGDQLRQARRLLTALANDPSLRGVAGFFELVGEGVRESAAPASVAGILDRMATTVGKLADGQSAEMPWRELFAVSGLEESNRRLVQVKPILNDNSLNRASDAIDALNASIAQVVEKYPDIKVRVTGEPVLRQQELNDAFSGALYASTLSFVLVALSLIIGIRSGRLIAALLLTLVVGSIWTTGLAAVAIGRLNLISVAFLVLFFGLGVDFGTHLGLRYLEEAKQGKSFRDALVAAMVGEGPSITLSAICAALAFLAFVPTTYTGLAEFGVISALGMLVAVVVTFTVQPALMALMPPRPKPGRGRHHRHRRVDRAISSPDPRARHDRYGRGRLLFARRPDRHQSAQPAESENGVGHDLSRSRARSRHLALCVERDGPGHEDRGRACAQACRGARRGWCPLDR